MTLPHPFAGPAWCRALTVSERIELLRRGPCVPRGGGERLARLRSRPPFDEESVFASWLQKNRWSDEELGAALAATAEDFLDAAPDPPRWWLEIVRAFGDGMRADAPPFPYPDPDAPQLEILRLFRPLVVRAGDRLHAGAAALAAADPNAPFEPGRAVHLLLAALTGHLYEISLRTLVLELNVARLRGQLTGDGPGDRFLSFVERLERPEIAAAILTEYPVLARLAVEAIERWERCSLELLRHLAADREALEAGLAGGRALGRLAGLRGRAGDTHRGGRSVQILEFDSGSKLVYKPRPLAVDRCFRELLLWLNARGDHPPFRTLELLDRGSHGWVEYVAVESCSSTAEVERFYERQGGFLALLYLLDANDFHFENLIAAGEHPVLVDLESLFAQRAWSAEREGALGRATDAVLYSVLRTGLLPRMTAAGDRLAGVDLSGLGGEAGQLGPAVQMPEAVGTDTMHVTHKNVAFGGGTNRPRLAGQAVRVTDFLPAVQRGFEKVYRTLVRHREELLAAGGPLAAFAPVEVRVLFRATQTYRLLMLDGFHPDLLRDAGDRDCHLDRLWLSVRARPDFDFVVAAEREEVAEGDVPCFGSRPGGRDLVSGRGRTRVDFFERTGLELVAERLRGFGERDLERQTWMIGASLVAMDSPLTRGSGHPPASLGSREPAEPERLLRAAASVRRRLGELALFGATGEVSWVGISATDERHFTPVALGADLYSGLAGIALFLAYLGETGDEAARSLAEATWRTIESAFAGDLSELTDIGAFTGLGGIAYTATHLGLLWRRQDILASARRVAGAIAAQLDEDASLDVLSGAAGCIPILLALARASGDGSAVETARRCGEHIVRRATPMPVGIGWRLKDERPLSGFSHGAAGFAWSLLALGRTTGEPRFIEASHQALAFERTLYDPAERNWRDLRSFLGPQGSFNVAWCHGAVGIALARMASLPLEEDPQELAEMWREMEIGLETTVRHGFGFDHSLCHGAMGTIELLAEAGRRLGRGEDLLRALQAGSAVCEEIEAGRFHCGVPGGFETPGLMDGLAGIGYGLLRLADPARVPSVLLLEPPRAIGVEARYANLAPAAALSA